MAVGNRIAGDRLGRDLSLIELAVIVVVIGLLFVAAIDRILKVFSVAEQVTLTRMVNEINAGLMLEAAVRLTRGDAEGLAALVDVNPVDLLQSAPPGYLGERSDAEIADTPGDRAWFYDPQARMLVYRVGSAEHFLGGASGVKRARFRVKLKFRDNDGNGRFDPGRDDFQGVALAPVEPYAWRSPYE